MILAFWSIFGKMTPEKKKTLISWLLWAVFLASAFWGIFLRVYALPNASLWMDEGFSYYAAKQLLETGRNITESGVTNWGQSIVFHFMQALSMFFLGQNEWGLRFPSLLFGILMPFLVFFGLRNIFPKHKVFPVIVSSFLFLSTWEISWSIQGRMYMVLQLFFLTSLFFLWKFFETKPLRSEIKYFLLFVCFALITSYVHSFGLILFLLSLITLPFLENHFWKKKRYVIIFSLILFGILIWKSKYIWNLISSSDFSTWYYIRFLKDNHSASLIFGLFTSVFLLLMRGFQSKRFLFFLTSLLITGIFTLEYFIPYTNYRYFFPFYPLLIVLSFSWLLLSGMKRFQEKKWIIPALFLILGQILSFKSEIALSLQKNYPLESDKPEYAEQRYYTPQPDFREGAHLIKARKTPGEIVISPYPEITRFYHMETDYVLPFDLNRKVDWNTMKKYSQAQKRQFTLIPYIFSLEEIDSLIKSHHGYFLIDLYAWEKLPDSIVGYIDANTELIWEKWESDGDSAVMVYRF